MIRKLAILLSIFGLVAIIMGGVFIGMGMTKSHVLTQAMRVEKITLGLTQEQINAGDILDTAGEALKAGDTIREHRHELAPTYNDLLAGGRFDPTNPDHVTYMQALNLENYLYLAVIGFSLTQTVTASGVFMIIAGVAFGGTGLALLRLGRLSEPHAG
jgi:hypothetical protein